MDIGALPFQVVLGLVFLNAILPYLFLSDHLPPLLHRFGERLGAAFVDYCTGQFALEVDVEGAIQVCIHTVLER